MPDSPELAFVFATKGMDASRDAALIADNNLARAVNVQLRDEIPFPRFGMRALPLMGDVQAYSPLNCQGAMFYNPAKGQGATAFGADVNQILECAGGRRWQLRVIGHGAGSSAFVSDVSNNLTSDPANHIAFWQQGENFAFNTQADGPAWTWDGANPAEEMGGLDYGQPENSTVPRDGGVMAYAHGRLGIAVGRKIYWGDSLHKTDQSSASNIREFTEQVYYETGSYTAPPTAMGDPLAAGILPTRNATSGHSETLFHCDDGVFSNQTNIAPRSSWDTQQISRHVLLRGGATGPYALYIDKADQFYRSPQGIETLRGAAIQTIDASEQYDTLSEEVETFFRADTLDLLRFASLVHWQPRQRLICTCFPQVDLRYRWHRGMVVMNKKPAGSQSRGLRSWEGLWVPPYEIGGIVQLVAGSFGGNERVFFLAWDPDTCTKHLVEIDQRFTSDYLPGGAKKRIEAKIRTRKMFRSQLWQQKTGRSARLYLKDVRGLVEWDVRARTNEHPKWTVWRAGSIEVDTVAGGLKTNGGRDREIPLGEFPKALDKPARWIQFEVRWRGHAGVEQIKFRHDSKGESEDDLSGCKFDESLTGNTFSASDDYEAAMKNPTW